MVFASLAFIVAKATNLWELPDNDGVSTEQFNCQAVRGVDECPSGAADQRLERFQAKRKPVRVKKTRQIKNLETRFDSIETEKALVSSRRLARADSTA